MQTLTEKTYMNGRTREVLREYAFLHQFSLTAELALQASSERRTTVMFLQIAQNALYPNMNPTQIYKRLRFRWRRYCEIRKRNGEWTLSRNLKNPDMRWERS